MIYKDFVAEAAQKIMAQAISHLSADDARKAGRHSEEEPNGYPVR